MTSSLNATDTNPKPSSDPLNKGAKSPLKKVVFVCSGNVDRSPTAEALLRSRKGYQAKSAGILPTAPAVISKELISWADQIFAMESIHKEAMLEIAPDASRKIVVLSVEDRYVRGDPELVRILREKLSTYLAGI